jgi:type IX secretion system PorP/SprF family membrane protein
MSPMRAHIRLLLLAAMPAGGAMAQHFQFSQFYAAPTYLNPAFTGANVCGRLSLNYRNQWSGIPGTFTTYQAAYDHYIRSAKSGIGVQVFHDRAGLGSLNTTQLTGLYAYEARLGKRVMGRGGLALGLIQRQTDLSKYVFADQLRDGTPHSSESFNIIRANYFDIGTGFLVYSQSTWLGFSAAHMNKPNQSLLNGTSPLPTELKFHGGYKFVIEELESSNPRLAVNNFVTIAMNYKKQNKFNQLDAGLYYTKDLFVIGAWYRGLPFFKPEESYANSDALILLLGMNVQKYKVGYSYDFTISKLTNYASHGSHEVSMSYQFCTFKKMKRRRNALISCPKF